MKILQKTSVGFIGFLCVFLASCSSAVNSDPPAVPPAPAEQNNAVSSDVSEAATDEESGSDLMKLGINTFRLKLTGVTGLTYEADLQHPSYRHLTKNENGILEGVMSVDGKLFGLQNGTWKYMEEDPDALILKSMAEGVILAASDYILLLDEANKLPEWKKLNKEPQPCGSLMCDVYQHTEAWEKWTVYYDTDKHWMRRNEHDGGTPNTQSTFEFEYNIPLDIRAPENAQPFTP